MTPVSKETNKSLRHWAKKLPHSTMVYPDGAWNRVKYIFWRAYIPLHPYVRDIAVSIGAVKHSGRQPFLLGRVESHIPMKSFISHLIDIGYGNHFVAWHDDDELVSVRMTDGFVRQYHLRVFSDGAVHGHYEYTPEAHPVLHIKGIAFEDRRDFFMEQFGELVIQATKKESEISENKYYSSSSVTNKSDKTKE